MQLLENWREKARLKFSELGLPKKNQEGFEYISFKDFSFPPAASAPKPENPSASSLLFVDGFFQGADLPQPLVALSLETALNVYGIFLENRFQKNLKEETDPLAAMNGAYQGIGAFLYVPPNTCINDPIEIHHRYTTDQMAGPRLYIVLGQGASLQIVQRSEGIFFSNSFIDISLDAGSSLFFGDVNNGSFQHLRATLKRDSRIHYLVTSNGAKLARSSIKMQLIEENSEACLQGLSILDADLQHHINTSIEHIAPNTRSRQHFKTILRGKAKSSFEGKILVRPEAQKTESYQLCNHLLLSQDAWSFAKPNLEIFADDVKASHGATVTQLNEEELFYLSSRGFPKPLAEEMLLAGFCNEILNSIPAGVVF